MPKQILIASNNAHKISEISHILNFDDWLFFSLNDAHIQSHPEETADTFLGNARIKARAARAASAGRYAVLADDSGLEVDALQGRPGVYSSRYAGLDGDDAANNNKLLEELSDLSYEKRSARFVCTLVFIDTDGKELTARGTIEGHIGFELKGEGGFGYDPLFYPLAYCGKMSLAQVSQSEKNKISHRGQALRNLYELIAVQLI